MMLTTVLVVGGCAYVMASSVASIWYETVECKRFVDVLENSRKTMEQSKTWGEYYQKQKSFQDAHPELFIPSMKQPLVSRLVAGKREPYPLPCDYDKLLKEE